MEYTGVITRFSSFQRASMTNNKGGFLRAISRMTSWVWWLANYRDGQFPHCEPNKWTTVGQTQPRGLRSNYGLLKIALTWTYSDHRPPGVPVKVPFSRKYGPSNITTDSCGLSSSMLPQTWRHIFVRSVASRVHWEVVRMRLCCRRWESNTVLNVPPWEFPPHNLGVPSWSW